MQPVRQTNSAGLALLRMAEGCRLEAYWCEAGKLTIGWGHTAMVTEGMRITQAQADQMLAQDVSSFERAVDRLSPAWLTSNQYSALVVLAYNIGVTNFHESTLLRKLRRQDVMGAANEFLVWKYVTDKKTGLKVVSSGLMKRRALERQLFLKGYPGGPNVA